MKRVVQGISDERVFYNLPPSTIALEEREIHMRVDSLGGIGQP